MRVRYLFFSFLLGSGFGGFLVHFPKSPVWEDVPKVNYQTIAFTESGSKIYASARAWGLAGNHEEVRLCSAPIKLGQTGQQGKCIVFYTNEMFYRKEGSERLHVYVDSSSVPNDQLKQLGSVEIVVTELRNVDKINDLEMNNDKYGLASIAAP
jgi:hypothetical protein